MAYALYAPHLPFGADLPATSATLSSALAAVRTQPCYSQEFEECINTTAPSRVSGCAAIRAGYQVDAKTMDAAVQSLKFCPASSAPSLGAFIAVGAIGVAVGVLLGGLVR
jgi:hypothetical protein